MCPLSENIQFLSVNKWASTGIHKDVINKLKDKATEFAKKITYFLEIAALDHENMELVKRKFVKIVPGIKAGEIIISAGLKVKELENNKVTVQVFTNLGYFELKAFDLH